MFTAYKSFAAIGDDILNLSKLLVSSFHMNAQETPQFWRYQVRTKPLLLESYCLVCNAFVAASPSQFNLEMVELVHLLKCRRPLENTEEMK
jgi:hypothetical protein